MSFQVGSGCYDTALLAAHAQAANAPHVLSTGGSPVSVSVQSVTESAISYRMTPLDASNSASYVSVSPFVAQPCVLLGAADAVSLSWMVSAVWLAVYGVMFLARIFKDDGVSDYGTS